MPDQRPLTFTSSSFADTVLLTSEALHDLDRYAQTEAKSNEAGGQLFARFDPGVVVIRRCSPPHPDDRRSRFGFWPNRKREQREIREFYAQGLHYVGDWHTHPEPHPTPSASDLDSMRSVFMKSKHALVSFLMIIRGTGALPDGIWVSAHDSHKYCRLNLAAPSVESRPVVGSYNTARRRPPT